jgi:hypothetical protein
MALLLIMLMLGWFGYQMWMPNNSAQVFRSPFDPACDLRAGPCETNLTQGAKVRFAIQPETIPVTEPLQLLVDIDGLEVDRVTVELNGVDMNMPQNKIVLEQTGRGRFRGKGSLSFCTRNAMEWEALVELAAGEKQFIVGYRFITLAN